MNKHFSDARYYLGRAASHLKIGLSEELEPVARRVRAKFGTEVDEPAEPETRAGRARVAAKRTVKQATRRVRGSRQPDEQAV
ncbi:hypothetical protein halTADL_2489 [Halohasta litchfieldiae]|jgi:hypothetical protein|uniref:Uncharacterized protein n=1 Tax=Halohasta litchfieldiae TaxID=1073996 RepID=A0A1H6S197_9EURY|nr:hypothetical protein [Halohasta litchfieldiae]ATW89223.1 hypothetical protein halTADL_2489 [Halohasta litchfieldiae]SEI57525.1 hypothetical protein SAMN05444271_10311 [Halohasta litchfieldiae]